MPIINAENKDAIYERRKACNRLEGGHIFMGKKFNLAVHVLNHQKYFYRGKLTREHEFWGEIFRTMVYIS